MTTSSSSSGQGSPSPKSKWTLDAGWATIVGAIISALTLVVVTAITALSAASSTATSAGPASKSNAAASPSSVGTPPAHLEFSLTPKSRVPWCQVYNGTGTVPAGYSFVIFDAPANSVGQVEQPASYSFDGAAEESAVGHWTTEPLQIGTRGVANNSVDIIGVLTARTIYSYISSIRAQNDLLWSSQQLPPGPNVTLPVITNGKRGQSCH